MDAEFFSTNSCAPIDDSLDAAVCREHKGLSRWGERNWLSASCGNGSDFGDLDTWSF
jgi:hypothetical protein